MDNKTVVLRYYEEVWNQRNTDALSEIWAPDFRRYLSPRTSPLNAAEQLARMQGLQTAFPDISMTVLDIVTEGDKICVRVQSDCTHKGDFMGKSATGKTIKAYAFEMMRLKDNQIVEHWGGPDIADMLRQIN